MKHVRLTKKDLENFLKQKLPKYKIEIISVKKEKQPKFKQIEINFETPKTQ